MIEARPYLRYSLVVAISLAATGCASVQQAWSGVFSENLASRARADLQVDAEHHYQWAKHWITQNRTEWAMNSLAQALEVLPSHVEALNARATLHALAGQFEKASADLDLALSISPDREHLHYNKALLSQLMTASQVRSDLPPVHKDEPIAKAPPLVATPHDSVVVVAERDLGRDAVESGKPSVSSGLAVVRLDPVELQRLGGALSLTESKTAPDLESSAVDHPIGRHLTPAETNAIEVTTVQLQSAAVAPDHPLDSLSSPLAIRAVGAAVIAPASPHPARIDIANGNGVNGMARAIMGQLRAVGVQVTTISNWVHFHQPVTQVLYRDGFEQAARELAERLPVPVELVASQRLSRTNRDVMVVLGRDMRSYRPTASGWEILASLSDINAA